MPQKDSKTGRFLKKDGSTPKSTAKAKATASKKAKPVAKAAAKKAKPKTKLVEAKAKKEAPKPKKTAAQKEIAEKIQKVLETPLKVFIKKDITGDAKNIGPGSSVILEKLSIIGPTGSNVFRVKRQNSDRTYYTVEENIPG